MSKKDDEQYVMTGKQIRGHDITLECTFRHLLLLLVGEKEVKRISEVSQGRKKWYEGRGQERRWTLVTNIQRITWKFIHRNLLILRQKISISTWQSWKSLSPLCASCFAVSSVYLPEKNASEFYQEIGGEV